MEYFANTFVTMALSDGTKKEIIGDVSHEGPYSLDDVEKHTGANILPYVEYQPDSKDLEKATSTTDVTAPGPMDPSSFPDGGLKAWLVVFGGACCLSVSFGWINCESPIHLFHNCNLLTMTTGIGVFQAYYQPALLSSYSPSTIAWISSIEAFMMFALGPIFGFVYDSHGPRLLLLFGSFCHVFGLMMASISASYYQILLSQGTCSAMGASAIFYAATCAVLYVVLPPSCPRPRHNCRRVQHGRCDIPYPCGALAAQDLLPLDHAGGRFCHPRDTYLRECHPKISSSTYTAPLRFRGLHQTPPGTALRTHGPRILLPLLRLLPAIQLCHPPSRSYRNLTIAISLPCRHPQWGVHLRPHHPALPSRPPGAL